MQVYWIADCCHSGDLTRDIAVPGKRPNKPRLFPIPVDMQWRIRTAKYKQIKSRSIINGMLDVGFISGCRSDQTSADTIDGSGRPCGAFTNHFLQVMNDPNAKQLTIRQITTNINQLLRQDGYPQEPQVEGTRVDKIWMT